MKTLSRLLLALLLLSLHAVGWAEEEPLDPEEAFALTLEASAPDQVRAHWVIADGYYLYASKFKLRSLTPGVEVGTLVLPEGIQKHDEFFGDIVIYKHDVALTAPLTLPAGVTRVELEVTSQGCAEIGICYPPVRVKQTLDLPAARTAPALAPLNPDLLGGGAVEEEDEVLDPDVAFPLEVTPTGDTLRVVWNIAPGHYLYHDKLEFTLKGAGGAQLGAAQLPAGEEKHDEFFGLIRVHHDRLEAIVPLSGALPAVGAQLEVKYQGCSERGICYPPMRKSFDLSSGANHTETTAKVAATASNGVTSAPTSAEPLSEQDSLAAALAGENKGLTILTFFGLGLLLAFTPCVFPMIPILSSIIVGQGEALTTRRAFTLSLAYVLAMAATYTVAGVVAGLFGSNLQATFQNPWILGSFSGLFMLLSLSMFGFYELQLPSSWQSKLSDISNQQQGGTLLGVAIMGALSALIVGPCVAPPLMGALIYIGQTGDALLGGGALFAMSLGMGLPLLAIGSSAGKLLPRAGAWMDAVKAVFGVAMLAVAVWMLERIIPAAVTMLLWAGLLIVSAIYMGAIEPVREGASGWTKLWKGLGFIMLVYGVILLLGTASGSHNPLQPLDKMRAGVAMAGGTTPSELHFTRIKSVADLERELNTAKAAGRPVMLDFYADWCTYCKGYERDVFPHPRVVATAGNGVMLQADVTDNDDLDQALLNHLGLTAPPALLFWGHDGQERKAMRVVGPMDAEAFAAHMGRAFE